jgi:hypothetical protein
MFAEPIDKTKTDSSRFFGLLPSFLEVQVEIN